MLIFVDEYFGDTLLHGEFRIGVDKFETFYEVERERKSMEKDVWDKAKYTVYLTALYYRIMEDESLRDKLLDEYFGIRIEDEGFIGQNQRFCINGS